MWTREASLRTQEPNRIRSKPNKEDRIRKVTTIIVTKYMFFYLFLISLKNDIDLDLLRHPSR